MPTAEFTLPTPAEIAERRARLAAANADKPRISPEEWAKEWSELFDDDADYRRFLDGVREARGHTNGAAR